MSHKPVLLNETIAHLHLKPNGIYIDGTFGRGGHTKAILKQLGPLGQVFAVDKDLEAIRSANENLADSRFKIRQGSFNTLYSWMEPIGYLGKVDGILLDLGVSSPQLDDPERGFSFSKNGPLDMRMDTQQSLDATSWINTAQEKEIITVLRTYGEERYARRIAAFIVKERLQAKIETTGRLAEIVAKAHPRWEAHKHPATRTFQAIRIFINQELRDLTETLPHCLEMLAVNGRLLVVTFHSLEERIVKDFMRLQGSTAHLPRELPFTQDYLESQLRLRRINGSIRPTQAEREDNPRARSATLHVMEKIK